MVATRTLSSLLNDPADANSTAGGLAATFSNSTSSARTNSGVAVGNLPTPALATTQDLLNYVPKVIWDDMLSGDPQLDHTAAVAAVLADTSLRSLVFPAGGIVNVDRFHIPATNTIKEFVFGACEVRQRANYTAGLGHFLRTLHAVPGYSTAFDDIRFIGGTINQNNKYTRGHLFLATYLRRSKIEDVTVIHRTAPNVTVTLDTGTDVFTAAQHGFVAGDVVAMLGGTTNPTGSLPSGTPYYVINATTDTFSLSATAGGAAINFTSTGSGGLFVSYFGSWAFCLGGTDLQIARPTVLNGLALYQDGVHIYHGSDIGVSNGIVYSGDDAYPVGYDTDAGHAEHTIANVSFDSCFGRSNQAFLFKCYVNDATASVIGVTGNFTGNGGVLRNGAVAIIDNTGTDPRTQTAKIENVVAAVNATVGSAARTQTAGAIAVQMYGAKDVQIDAKIERDTYPFKDFSLTLCSGVEVGLKLTGDTPVVVGSNTSTYETFVAVEYPNSIPNPQMAGAVTGVAAPTGWTVQGVTSSVTPAIVVPGKYANRQPLGIHYTGTASAAIAFSNLMVPTTAIAAVSGEVHRAKCEIACLGGSLTGVTATLQLQERNSSGSLLASSAVDITLSSDFLAYEVTRTLNNALTAFITLALFVNIADTTVADFTIGIINPALE